MSFRSALSELFSSSSPSADEGPATDARNQIKQGLFTNVKVLILVAFVALLAWNATSKILTPEVVAELGGIVKLFIIVEGAVHLAVVLGNTFIKYAEIKAFSADGTLSDNEVAVLRGTPIEAPKPVVPAKA